MILHLDSDEAGGGDLIAEDSAHRRLRANSHRSFKIKVGRGARHMPLEAGTRRDIAVIKAVREAVGPEATIMIDANNGYILNIAKRVLAETADCNALLAGGSLSRRPRFFTRSCTAGWMQEGALMC